MSGSNDQHVANRSNKSFNNAGNSDGSDKHMTFSNEDSPSQSSFQTASTLPTAGTNPTLGNITPISIQQYAVGPVVLSSDMQLGTSSLPLSFIKRSGESGGSARNSQRSSTQPPNATDAAKSRMICRIRTPHPHDVLCGRGGGINSHPGNKTFRDWVRDRKELYNLATSKAEKARISREIITKVQELRPPGRFLMREEMTTSGGKATPVLSHAGSFGCGSIGWWIEIDDIKAMAKTSQALREGAPNIRAQHKDPDARFSFPGTTSSKSHSPSKGKSVPSKTSTLLPTLSHAGLPISAEALNSLSKEQLKNQANEAVTAVAELRHKQQMLHRNKLLTNDATAFASVARAEEPIDYSFLSTSSATQALVAAAAVAQTQALGSMENTKTKVVGSNNISKPIITVRPSGQYGIPPVHHSKFAQKKRTHPLSTSNFNFSETVANELAQSLEPSLKVKKQIKSDDVFVAAHTNTILPDENATPTPRSLSNTDDASLRDAQTNLNSQTLQSSSTAMFSQSKSNRNVSNHPQLQKKQLTNIVPTNDHRTRSYTRAHSLALSESSGLEGLNDEDFRDPFENEEHNLRVAAMALADQKSANEKDESKKPLGGVSDAFESSSSSSGARQIDKSTRSPQSNGARHRSHRLLRNVSSNSISENSSASCSHRRDSGDCPENGNCCKGDTSSDNTTNTGRRSRFQQHGLGSRSSNSNRSVTFSDSSAGQNEDTMKSNRYGKNGSKGQYTDQPSRRNIVSAQ